MKLTVFSSDMVLQQGKPAPVWGTAAPGTVVRGRLEPAGGPYTLALRAGEEQTVFQNVWLAGGQSNMELTLASSRDGAAVLARCADPRLHFYATPKVTTPEAAALAQSRWQPVRPDTAAGLSAAAYYAAAALARALDVHVGILECFWGGTYAHCWMPRSLLAPGWFIYLLLPLFLAGGSVTALGMAALMRPAVARMEQAGRKPEPPRGQTPACIWYLHRV